MFRTPHSHLPFDICHSTFDIVSPLACVALSGRTTIIRLEPTAKDLAVIMGLIVQKFGGTSVADAEKIHRAARRAIASKE